MQIAHYMDLSLLLHAINFIKYLTKRNRFIYPFEFTSWLLVTMLLFNLDASGSDQLKDTEYLKTVSEKEQRGQQHKLGNSLSSSQA